MREIAKGARHHASYAIWLGMMQKHAQTTREKVKDSHVSHVEEEATGWQSVHQEDIPAEIIKEIGVDFKVIEEDTKEIGADFREIEAGMESSIRQGFKKIIQRQEILEPNRVMERSKTTIQGQVQISNAIIATNRGT